MRELLNSALQFAAEHHAAQSRKTSGVPYILHPMEVAAIIGTLINDEEVMAAGVLHDVVEDTGATRQEIEARFGDRVAMLVMSESEDKRPGLPASKTWKKRKEESLAELKAAEDEGVAVLWLADKLANLRSLWQAYRVSGDKAFDMFHMKAKAEHAWYYVAVAEAVAGSLGESGAYEEYMRLYRAIFE